jgi:hypothetical protein
MPNLPYTHLTFKSQSQTGTFTDGNGTVTEINIPLGYYNFYDNKEGGNTPGWPEVIQENSFFRQVVRREDSLLSLNGKGIGHSAHTEQSIPPTAFLPSGDLSGGENYGNEVSFIRDTVVRKLQDKLLDQKVNVGQFIAERQQTINLVTSTARRIAESIHSIRRGNLKHAIYSLTGSVPSPGLSRGIKRRFGGVPEQYLALKYGWQPLLSDIYGSCEELANHATDSPPALSASASAKMDLPPRTGAYGTGGYYPKREVSRDSGTIAGRGSLVAKLSSGFGQGLARTGLINPYQVAWELIPYSFVVDWFLPVGNFLTRLNYDTGLVFSHGYFACKVTDSWSLKWPEGKHLNYDGLSLTYSGGGVSYQISVAKREALSSFPSAVPPRFKDPLSLTHTAEALSLLAVAAGRPKGLFDFMK